MNIQASTRDLAGVVQTILKIQVEKYFAFGIEQMVISR